MARLAIAGAGGRMGRELVAAVCASKEHTLAAAMDLPQSPALGKDAGVNTGVIVTSDIRAAIAASDVLIDFTRPAGTLAHLAVCRELGKGAVVGTTGFEAAQRAELQALAEHIPIVFAANMSLGVNVMLKLVEMATRALHENFDMEVIEAHHKLKVDAPSGTALMLGETMAKAVGQPLKDIGVFERHGTIGERKTGTIGFSTIRGGDIIGDHTVMFAGTGERIEITHRSQSRATYSQGALRAASFVATKRSGLFDMSDVLGLR